MNYTLIAKDRSELEKILYLQDTAIGKGVFAKRYFEVGEVIALLSGTLIDDPFYNSTYCIEMGPELSLEPDPPFRFINHCCNPNCWLISYVDDGADPLLEEQLCLYVRTSIYPGEEITIDYAWPADSAIECQCGDAECRGWIVDESEIDNVLEAQRKKDWVIVECPRCSANPNPEIILPKRTD